MHKYTSVSIFSVLLTLSFTLTANAEEPDLPSLEESFSEDGPMAQKGSPWSFEFSGYARLPIRFADSPLGDRNPDLVDDNYSQSGFGYLRVNETEWVEMVLSARREKTRIVTGLFASDLSDWSDRAGQSSTPAFAFVEQAMDPHPRLSLDARVGMFWRRLGYVAAYDTYLIGRTHTAGALLSATAFDHFVLEVGGGGHARNTREVFGFGPQYWVVAGVEHPMIQAHGYLLKTWNEDDDASRSYTKNGEFKTLGFDTKLALSAFGTIAYTFSFIDAKNIEFIGRGVEVLHSLDGKNLKLNFLGSEQNGTGEIQNQALEVTWELERTARALLGSGGSILHGTKLDVYGMTTLVATPHEIGAVGDPGKNDRRYLKWGTDLSYTMSFLGSAKPTLAMRFDRVQMHSDHDSLSFRVYSPRIGCTLTSGVDAFVQWSRYDYGDNITADFFNELAERATRSANANLAEVRPDTDVVKLQVQARW